MVCCRLPKFSDFDGVVFMGTLPTKPTIGVKWLVMGVIISLAIKEWLDVCVIELVEEVNKIIKSIITFIFIEF